MPEKTSTPDDNPDRRATVVTDDPASDEQVVGPPTADAPVAGAPAAGGPAAEAGESRPSNGSGPAAAPQAGGPAVVAAPADAPTTEMRVPTNGSASRTDAPRPNAPKEQALRTPVAPAPAPGPIPGPGPDAVGPPPWNRTPGRDTQERRDQERRDHERPAPDPRGSVLDEGPTAFLQAPPRDERVSETGGFAQVRATRNRPPRQAALQLRRIDPWSALKLALVLAVVLFFVWLVAVGVLYGVLDGIGVWDRLNGTYADLVSGEAQTGAPLISAGRVFGFAAVIGAVNSLLFAVAVTLGAFIYNVSADLVGGVEVTLSERD